MKGQTVYVVTEESAVDGQHEIFVNVYTERKDAIKRWQELVEISREEINSIPGSSSVWYELVEREGSYEAWHDSDYDRNHVTIYLIEEDMQ